MCSSKLRLNQTAPDATPIAKLNGRPVLQPKSNQVPSLERKNSLKKNSPKSHITKHTPLPLHTTNVGNKTRPSSLSPPLSPKLKSPRPPPLKRGNELNAFNSSPEKVSTPKCATKLSSDPLKKPKRTLNLHGSVDNMKNSASLIVEAPGSIAAMRREQVAIMQEQRKMRIAHYGRTKSSKFETKIVPLHSHEDISFNVGEKKRCSFITQNSDPIYVAYHDEEWGVPVHDDKVLFELLVLTAAQVGSDWSTVLKKRKLFREAFSEFDAEVVAKFIDKKITCISVEYGMDISQVRGVVDNSKCIVEVKKTIGSFDKYLWGFVNNKPICNQYKSCQKIPVKTSKSETISKDMVKRGFRNVGPTVILSFMQASGLSNDHLITCPRHIQCSALATETLKKDQI